MEQRNDLRRTADELTTYAAERQAGFERHQTGGASRRPETRNEWIRNILLGMAEVDGADGGEVTDCFDRQLEEARGCFGVEVLPELGQKHVVQSLMRYASALEQLDGDQRRRLMQVQDLLGDMMDYLSWDSIDIGLYPAWDQVTGQILRQTAQRPIRFTRALLGGDRDPGVVEAVPGLVDDPEGVRRTQEFQRLIAEYPKRDEWPARCTVWQGGGQQAVSASVDANDLDMEIIRKAGDRFLKQPGVNPVCSQHLHVPVYEQIRALRVEPGRLPEEVTIPNTLDALQAAVGGDIDILDLDIDAALVCNENGKVMGLPANQRVGGDIIAGTFLIVGTADGEFCSLADDAAAYYTEHFAEPISEQSPDGLKEFTFYIM